MEDEHSLPRLPITPVDPSLAAHLAALDTLAYQLLALSRQPRAPARIPLNTKASFNGHVTNTNAVKVNVGGEWWVEMTAEEAAGYLRRRRRALLEEHARMQEGGVRDFGGGSGSAATNAQAGPSRIRSLDIPFNPLFPSPIPRVMRSTSAEFGPLNASETASAPAPKQGKPEAASREAAPAEGEGELDPLADVIGQFVDRQKLQVAGADSGLNEEGLPIHEIREDEHGNTLGPLPTPTTTTGGEEASGLPSANEESDYWSEEAVRRRAALRRKLFHESDSDTDEREESSPPPPPAVAIPTPIPVQPPVSSPAISVGPAPPSAALAETRPSSNAPTKGILKPPTRKKSVSFDESVPLPPDSPDTAAAPHKFGFSLPLSGEMPTDPGMEQFLTSLGVGGGEGGKTVPVIPEPKPKAKGAGGGGDGLAGFKRGFLASRTGPPAVIPAAAGASDEVKTEEPKKKASLFAQRRAEQEQVAAPHENGSKGKGLVVPPGTPVAKIGDGLPRMSKSPQTIGLKDSVIEKAPPVAKPRAEPSIVAGPSKSSGLRNLLQQGENTYDGEDNEGEDDEDLDEDEDEDEDEYNLDDALLAREVALEYHRRRAYRAMEGSNDEGDEGEWKVAEEAGGPGGVMLALPQVSGEGPPEIVNPTRESLRKYIRVGRLENGNLVLAPGEQGWSDEEGEDEDDIAEEKRRKREEVRRQLLGEAPGRGREEHWVEDLNIAGQGQARGSEAKANGKGTAGVAQTVKERVAAPTVEEVVPPEPPKKVSRFKANRLGGA